MPSSLCVSKPVLEKCGATAHLILASFAQVCSLFQLLELSPGKIPMQTWASLALPLHRQ